MRFLEGVTEVCGVGVEKVDFSEVYGFRIKVGLVYLPAWTEPKNKLKLQKIKKIHKNG